MKNWTYTAETDDGEKFSDIWVMDESGEVMADIPDTHSNAMEIACLIAAAPDMLEILQALRQLSIMGLLEPKDIQEMTTKVIAQATGEETPND